MRRKILSIIMVAVCFGCAACGSSKSTEKTKKTEANIVTQEPSTTLSDSDIIKDEQMATSEDDVNNFNNSTPENDTDLGLKNIKIDLAEGQLTPEQKLVIKYFSRDYFFTNSIESLQRYPDIFENGLIESYVGVKKVLKSDNESFELLVCMMESSNEAPSDVFDMESRYMILRGEQTDARFIQGDEILVEGRYMGTETVDVDGVSYVIPVINAHNTNILDHNDPYYYEPSKFSTEEVKTVAKCIFGEDITVRLWNDEEYFPSTPPMYTCILDNQSNAKFSKYFFDERHGRILDASDFNTSIEFASDFEHFFLFMYDDSTETLTLEYYDNQLNKIWKREFEETTSAGYDITKNNIYLSANNKLYIINVENGEDTFSPNFIGSKIEVRKLNNGILTVGSEKSDAVIMSSLDGKMQWSVNLSNDIRYVESIQVIGDNIVMDLIDSDYRHHYVAINEKDGTLIQDNLVDVIEFQQYG